MTSTHNRNYVPGQYSDLSYKAAAMKGDDLIAQAAKCGSWLPFVEALVELRQVMRIAPRG